VDVAALDLGCDADLRFSVEYVRQDGMARRVPLAVGAGERFEDAVPVRSFRWAKGSAHFPGFYPGHRPRWCMWVSSRGWNDHVMLMDFDPGITGIASQPFWLHWHDEDGRRAARRPRR
jgi:hypothetical protein